MGTNFRCALFLLSVNFFHDIPQISSTCLRFGKHFFGILAHPSRGHKTSKFGFEQASRNLGEDTYGSANQSNVSGKANFCIGIARLVSGTVQQIECDDRTPVGLH